MVMLDDISDTSPTALEDLTSFLLKEVGNVDDLMKVDYVNQDNNVPLEILPPAGAMVGIHLPAAPVSVFERQNDKSQVSHPAGGGDIPCNGYHHDNDIKQGHDDMEGWMQMDGAFVADSSRCGGNVTCHDDHGQKLPHTTLSADCDDKSTSFTVASDATAQLIKVNTSTTTNRILRT